jgi:hypothetical protein
LIEQENNMTSFVHTDYPAQHPGVDRAEHVIESFTRATAQFEGARGVASLLLAALVAALMVVANQVIETWSDGHLLAAWIAMWLVAFAALALLAHPVRHLAIRTPLTIRNWMLARRQAAQDAHTWACALRDPRLMADLQRAMDQVR